MSEYTEVERPFLAQLAAQGWTVIDQGAQLPQDAAPSLRSSFRPWWLPGVFRDAVRAINLLPDGAPWLAEPQLDELESQLFRQPQRTLLEANQAAYELLIKTQVDVNETTGEVDPVVRLIDFHHPERNRFHAINQFRIATPGGVREFVVPDIVLFVNGIPLAVVECKKGSATCANPMQEAFVQLQRYMRRRPETEAAGLKEGEPRLFHTNLLLIRSAGLEADYGGISSGEEYFYAWKTLYPADDAALAGLNPQQQLVAGMLTRANLLQMLRTCTVFMDTDAGTRVKVVCRYQQFRAAGKIVQRLRSGHTALERSGVVWHTQGSGKSLTMVFVARMLRASTDLNDFKIVLVNDRHDLEGQLGETATLIGGRVNVIGSTQELRRHLASDSSDLNMVMVHKFQEREQVLSNTVAEALGTSLAKPAGKAFGVVNASDRIVLNRRQRAERETRLRREVRRSVPRPQRRRAGRHPQEVRRNRRHSGNRSPHQRHCARPGAPLCGQHPAQWLQGAGGVPFQAGLRALQTRHTDRNCRAAGTGAGRSRARHRPVAQAGVPQIRGADLVRRHQ